MHWMRSHGQEGMQVALVFETAGCNSLCVRVCLPLKQLGTVRGTIHCEVNVSTRVVPSTVGTHTQYTQCTPRWFPGSTTVQTHAHAHTLYSTQLSFVCVCGHVFACVCLCLPVFACVTVATMHNRRKQQSVTHGTVCLLCTPSAL